MIVIQTCVLSAFVSASAIDNTRAMTRLERSFFTLLTPSHNCSSSTLLTEKSLSYPTPDTIFTHRLEIALSSPVSRSRTASTHRPSLLHILSKSPTLIYLV
jgi:hypothetical protein